MTSNLASEEIAEHGMQLREEAQRVLDLRLDKNTDGDQTPEHIEISRKFKDEVVRINLPRILFTCTPRFI